MTSPSERRDDALARNVLSEQVKDRLLQKILEGELTPGSRIVETRVAKELGVSQAPVREALRGLATLGVVEMQPYRGARVRQPTKSELVEAMELRGELEVFAARRAAKHITEDELDVLRGLIDDMREMAQLSDPHGHAQKNTAFHAVIVEASRNQTLLRLWSMLEPYARTYFTAMVPGTDLRWLGDRHLVLLEALEERDPDKAAAAMRAHTTEAEELVLAMDEARFGRGSSSDA